MAARPSDAAAWSGARDELSRSLIGLRDHFGYGTRVRHAGQSFFQSVAFDEQGLVVQAEQMQNGRVPVLDADAILDRREAQIIRRAEHEATLDPSAAQPSADGVLVVVASGFVRVFVARLTYEEPSNSRELAVALCSK